MDNLLEHKNLLPAVLVLLMLVIVGQAYLFYHVLARPGLSGAPNPQMPGGPSDTIVSTGQGEGVGFIVGSVTSVDEGTLVVSAEGAEVQVLVPAGTPILAQGEMKTMAAQQKEIDSFNAQYVLLLENPEANREQIRLLTPPLPFETKALALLDLKAGDMVSVLVRAGERTALRVLKMSPIQ